MGRSRGRVALTCNPRFHFQPEVAKRPLTHNSLLKLKPKPISPHPKQEKGKDGVWVKITKRPGPDVYPGCEDDPLKHSGSSTSLFSHLACLKPKV